MRAWRGVGDLISGYLITLLAVAAAAAVSGWFDEWLTTLNVSLIYLFVVLFAATTYGYGPAILASVLGVLSFYFEFYPPYGLNSDLQIEDWLTLIFFLAFAIATSRLASSVRARAEEARVRAAEALAREREVRALQQLSESLQAGDDLEMLRGSIASRVREAFDLHACEVTLADAKDAGGAAPAASGAVDLPLCAGGAMVAVLHLIPAAATGELSDEDMRVLSLFATQAGLAIERAKLATEARSAAVLREADRLKTALLRTMSHDLRTPLATIKARASSLLEGDVTATDGEWQESMRAIDAEADRLERIVREVLDLSRLEAGAVPLRLELYTADEVVSAVLPQLEYVAQGYHLQIDVDPELPAAPMDIALVTQMLANLLENAFKYAPRGSTVVVSAASLDSGLLFRVVDEGPGIPVEVRERVFDAFYRVPRPLERQTTGAGLGLAICRAIAAAHGGRIWVEDGPQGGAALMMWLPEHAQWQVSATSPLSVARSIVEVA